jgi:hypothetical protein
MLLLAAFASSPAWAQTDIGSVNLGVLGHANGTVTFGEANSYDAIDEQRFRLSFSTASAGRLKLSLLYEDEIRSPVIVVCPDPDDPNTCSPEPSGDYQDYAGVNLTRFVLTPSSGAPVQLKLPDDLDSVTAAYGFASVWTSYLLEDELAIGRGAFTADIYGFGVIRAASFDGTGGGLVSYSLDFTAVPEPASWALMIGGFGLIGLAQRRRRQGAAVGLRTSGAEHQGDADVEWLRGLHLRCQAMDSQWRSVPATSPVLPLTARKHVP